MGVISYNQGMEKGVGGELFRRPVLALMEHKDQN